MSKKLTVFVILTVFLAINQVSAKGNDKFQFSFELLNMRVKGNDVHVGDVFRYTETQTSGNNSFTIKYGTTYDPIITKMRSDFAPKLSLSYYKDNWGFGASGWSFKTSGSASGRVVTPAPKYGDNFSEYSIWGVRTWGHSISPTYDQRQESGRSPVDFFARNDLSILSADMFSVIRLVDGLEVVFGGRVIEFENRREEGQDLQAFFTQTFKSGEEYEFFNQISLQSQSKAKSSLKGPFVGANILGNVLDLFDFDVSFKQAYVFGNANLSGNWDDVDDITIDIRPIDVPSSTWTILFDGDFPFNKKEQVTVPVTELDLKISRVFFDHFRFGLGAFISTYFNMPVAPSWSVPGAWTALRGTGWKTNRTNLSFEAVSASITVAF